MNYYETYGKKSWRIIYPGLVFIGVELLISFVGSFFIGIKLMLDKGEAVMEDMGVFIETWLEYFNRYTITISAVAALAVIPLMLLFMRMDRKRDIALGTYRVYAKPTALNCVVIFCLGIAAAATANNLLEISGLNSFFAEESEALGEALYQDQLLIEIIGIGILGPIAEELTFRGVTHKRCRDYLRPGSAMFLSALLFAVFHGNMIQLVYAFMLGLLLAFVYNKYESVIASIMLHVGANLFSVIVSETSVFDFMEENNTAYIAYVAVAAVLTIVFMYFVYMDKDAVVLTPSASDMTEGSQTQDL